LESGIGISGGVNSQSDRVANRAAWFRNGIFVNAERRGDERARPWTGHQTKPAQERHMNRDYILWNLREAQEAVSKIIRDIEADPEYSQEAYAVDIAHLYHHVNTAWNARFESAEAAERCSAEDFERWRQFPDDIDMSSGG
jgi:hypothetical protein